MKRKNFIGRRKARQRVALEQVENRIKRNGERADGDTNKPELTKDQKRQRVLQAKEEKALLDKRV
jgi:hypothetical protein